MRNLIKPDPPVVTALEQRRMLSGACSRALICDAAT
jgi:hypothetical protein